MYLNQLVKQLEKSVKGDLLLNEPLAKHTSWRVGGPADLLFLPKSFKDIETVLKLSAEHEVPVTVMGNGTNLLVLDGGVEGLVLKLMRIRYMNVEGSKIRAGAGVLLPNLSRYAQDNNLSGLEYAAGIPASAGGAVISNAGAHGENTGEKIECIKVFNSCGELSELKKEQLWFGYRTSSLKNKRLVVAEVLFSLNSSVSKKEISEKIERNINFRKLNQPVGSATAGSVFVNPHGGEAAGYLIEKAGLKGFRRGNAKVSEKHANFIINEGEASASDIISLIHDVKRKVFEKFRLHLEPEIQIIGTDRSRSGGESCGRKVYPRRREPFNR